MSYTYPDGTAALKNISFDIYEQESIGIIGANGAGKSTLLLHFNGILRVEEGEINIFGLSFKRKDLTAIRRIAGLVFQDPDDQLFMPTVFDDIAFGPMNLGYRKGEVENKVKQALTEVGLPDIGKRLAHHLSLGEKKRVALATVLAMDLKIILLDEPTSNLDARAKKQVMKIVKNLPLVKVIATHDLDLVSVLCNRVIVLDHGEKVADGETRTILSDDKLLQEYGLK